MAPYIQCSMFPPEAKKETPVSNMRKKERENFVSDLLILLTT